MADQSLTVALTLEDRMSGPAKKASGSIAEISRAMDPAATSAGGLSDALGGAGESAGGAQMEMAELTGGLSLVAEAAGAAALVFGALVFEGAKMAIEASEAREKMVTLFGALGEGKITGEQTIAMIDQLGDQIGQTREKLAPLTQGFLTMGITGTEQLRSLTLAAASAGAIADGGAEKFTAMFGVVNAAAETGSKLTIPFKKLEKQLQGVGLNIGDLASKMGMSEEALTKGLKAGTVDAKAFGDALTGAATDKGAGPLDRAGQSLTNVWDKFKENISKMFEGVDVGPFLAEVKDLAGVFGQNTASGKAMKSAIGGAFKFIFDAASKVVPYVKHFFLDLVIWSLKGYILLKKHWSEIKSALIGVGLAVGAVVVALGLMAAVAAAPTALLVALGVGIAWVNTKLVALASWAIRGGIDFVQGFVDGITGGIGKVKEAAGKLADAAKNSVEDFLGINSPSTVMMQLGAHTGSGFAGGIADAAPDVGAVSAGMGASAYAGASSGLKASDYSTGGAGGYAGGGASGGGTVGPITINLTAPGGVTNAIELTEVAVSALFERLALQQGA